MKGRVVWVGAAVVVLGWFTVPVFAQGVYKWVDAEGNVHYGERPPGDAPAAEVTLKNSLPAAPVSPQNRQENTQRVLRALEEERAKKQEQSAKAAQDAAQRKVNCNEARDRQRQNQEAGRLYKLDAKGERVYLDDNQRAAAMQRTDQDVKKFCK